MATNNNSSVGSTEHIVKTTKQWAERAMEYYVIPRGCLCVELTTDKKIKLKVGEGNKFYKQLPYVHEPTDLTSYYTKNEILQIIRSIEKMTIKSVTVYDDISDLPSINNEIGDVRFVKRIDNDDPDTYVWVGKWRMVGAPYFDITKIDFVNHEELTQVDTRVKFLEDNYHNHYNKDILDLTTQPYTVQDKAKLDSLFNYDDTLIKQDIANVENKLHNHDNKTILDGITKTALWSSEDRTKFKDLKNYDDADIKKRLDDIEKDEHTHENKEILDKISQQVLSNIHTHENKELLDKIDTIFTQEEKDKLANITSASYKNFVGTDGLYTGMPGLVPAPKTSDAGKVLSSSGKWITPPTSSGETSTLYKGAIIAGPGIQIIPPSPGITASYLRLEFGSVRNGNILEVQRIRITDNNSQAITFSAVTDTFVDGTTPQYENSGSDSPQAMINGTGRMCCVNFGSSRLRLTLTLRTPICIDNLNSFSYLTGVYESGYSKEDRDPMSWYIYASADGTTWTEIMNVPNGNVTTSRNTWTTPEPFMVLTSPSTIRVSDSYINSLIEEYIRTH